LNGDFEIAACSLDVAALAWTCFQFGLFIDVEHDLIAVGMDDSLE
jgi:hypothetical protein